MLSLTKDVLLPLYNRADLRFQLAGMEILAQVDASLVSTFDTSCDAKDTLAGETTCASVFPRAAGLNKFSNAKNPQRLSGSFVLEGQIH